MAFFVGQRVICVDDSVYHDWFNAVPTKGSVYVIREILTEGPSVGIRIVSLINPPRIWDKYPHLGFQEPCFRPSRFRPVVERKTDISIFTSMLTKPPAKTRRVRA